MSMTMLRGLLEAALARGLAVPTPEAETMEDPYAIRRGFAYVCRRCDVYGYLGPDDARMCWACEQDDELERR